MQIGTKFAGRFHELLHLPIGFLQGLGNAFRCSFQSERQHSQPLAEIIMQFRCQPGALILLSIDEHAAKAHLLVSCGTELLPLEQEIDGQQAQTHKDQQSNE